MAKNSVTVEQRLEQLENENRRMAQVLGLSADTAAKVTERADYIEHGSAQHAIFLGLVEVEDQDMEDAIKNKYILFESPLTRKTWRLEDEISPFVTFPNPEKVALNALRQKVSELESGKPSIPLDAPPLLVPQSAF